MTSILVRKHCQPALDEAGYPMFFATVSDGYDPMLVIYTTCGKPFANVHGVRFSKRKPTIAEAEYSGVLLQQWMVRHKKDFEAYVDAYIDFHSMKLPKKEREKNGIRYTMSDRGVAIIRKHSYVDDEGETREYEFSCLLNAEGKLISISWPEYIPLTPSELTAKTRLTKAMLNTATELFEAHAEYRRTARALDEASEKVRSCKI